MSKWKSDKIKQLLNEMSVDERTDMLADMLSAPDSEIVQIELSMMGDFTAEAEERNKNFGQMQGISTGYEKLDKLTRGLVPGELIVLAGKTSHGKTTLAMNIANNVALTKKTVLFVTLEMTHAEITSRYMYINGGNTDNYQTASALTVFQTGNELNWRSIDPLMAKARDEMGVDLVVIDHLHYFTRELENVAEDLGRITKEFKKNAIVHGIPVILISHVRKTQRGGQSGAGIEDLRGSSYIAQDADIVLMVDRDKRSPEYMDVRIEKNRNRGFDYNADTAQLYLDKIKIWDSAFDKSAADAAREAERQEQNQKLGRPAPPF